MPVTIWNTGNPINYVEIVAQAFAVARGGAVKNFFNVYHFRRTATTFPLVKGNINSAYQAAIGAAVLAAVNVDYTQTANTIRFFEDPLDPPISFSETGIGSIAGVRLPDYNAVVIQLKSGIRGKPYRGSKHYGPIAVADVIGDDLTAGAITRFNALASAIDGGFTDASGNVWVPGLKGAPRDTSPAWYETAPTTTVWTDILYTLLNKSLGTMKRRKIRTVN